ncbi:MAG: hypothetical protein J5605_04820 [Bacteroidales bacterium]|nr:hypothetical protein [Bacteroidales bacterium]
MNNKTKTALALGGITVLAGACGTTREQATVNPDTDSKNATIDTKESLEKRLKELTAVRYDTAQLLSAMCYSMAAPIEEDYTCPVCGGTTPSTSYQNGNIRSISKVVDDIKALGYDAILDEREFCQKCSGKRIGHPSLIFKIRLRPNDDYHAVKSTVYEDYNTLYNFLKSESTDDFVNFVSNNKKKAEKAFETIKKMTGLEIDK